MRTEATSTTTKKGILAVLALASVLLLSTGCAPEVAGGGGGGGAGGSSDGTSDGNGDGSGDGSNDGSADGSDDSSKGDDSSTGILTGKKCLPGSWSLDNEDFGRILSKAANEAGGPGNAVDKVTGTVILTLTANGETHTRYTNWSHEVTVDTSVITVVKNGTDDGTYTVTDDGVMTMVDVEIKSKTVSKMDINGTLTTTTIPPEPSVFAQAGFACSGDELKVTNGGVTATMHRTH